MEYLKRIGLILCIALSKDGNLKFEFRPLTENDLEWFLNIRNECRSYLHCDKEFTLEECRKWFKTDKPERYTVIVYEDQDIGYFRTIRKTAPYIDNCVLVIVQIGADIHQDWRGKGLAYKAYREFFRRLKEDSVDFVELEVLGTNTRAYTLYRKLNFVVQNEPGEDVKRGRELIPSIRMGKWLK